MCILLSFLSHLLTAVDAFIPQDAYILGTLLTHPLASRLTLRSICTAYDAVRRPAAQSIACASRDAGLLYTLNYPGLTFPREQDAGQSGAEDEERLQEVYHRLKMGWEWAWDTTAEGDVHRATEMFEAACS